VFPLAYDEYDYEPFFANPQETSDTTNASHRGRRRPISSAMDRGRLRSCDARSAVEGAAHCIIRALSPTAPVLARKVVRAIHVFRSLVAVLAAASTLVASQAGVPAHTFAQSAGAPDLAAIRGIVDGAESKSGKWPARRSWSARQGQTLLSESFGKADLELDVPMPPMRASRLDR
jgi:hypothetical protein